MAVASRSCPFKTDQGGDATRVAPVDLADRHVDGGAGRSESRADISKQQGEKPPLEIFSILDIPMFRLIVKKINPFTLKAVKIIDCGSFVFFFYWYKSILTAEFLFSFEDIVKCSEIKFSEILNLKI